MRLRTFQHLTPLGKINVTPLIDVIMVLIVFYLLVGRLASDRAKVDLPETGAGARSDAVPSHVLSITSDASGRPRYALDEEAVPAADLAARLRSAIPDPANAGTVHIRADRLLSFSAVEPALTACREAGLSSVKLVAERGR